MRNLLKWLDGSTKTHRPNVDNTKFPLFHNGGKQFNAYDIKILFNNNEPNKTNSPLTTELQLYHSNHNNNDKQDYKLLGIYFDEHHHINR
jgi:hypothetical protein